MGGDRGTVTMPHRLDRRAWPEGALLGRRQLLGMAGAVGGATALGWLLGVDQAAAIDAPDGRTSAAMARARDG